MPSDKNIFDRYLLALRKTSLTRRRSTRIVRRSSPFLQAVADGGANGATVRHEPKLVAAKGAPDFKVTKGALILGYTENKAIGENLDKVPRSGQVHGSRNMQ